MIYKQVQIANIRTLADFTLRICTDVNDTNSEDAKAAYELMKEPTTMVLCRTEDLPTVIREIGEQLLRQ